MKNLKAIIVDDERLARINLRKLLAQHKQIEIVGEAGSCSEAGSLINFYKPDLIFLDIQLSGETGFDLLEIANPAVKVVFVTAYDEYALRAFEINAMDYLLKPVDPERLKVTVERLCGTENEEKERKTGFEYTDKIYARLNNYTSRFISISSITFIEPVGNYSMAYTINKQHFLVLKTLKQWEDELPADHFIRIHRSSIINIDHIDRIEKDTMAQQKAYIKNLPQPLEVSRRYARRLKNIFSNPVLTV
ncbi:MAG TPA: LytTR family transcriptional regulator DNA-binding domain-containing protein [Bacteroidales bacterium]|nr:LytTR family transcriptional regulator DNA-binding domain-containing protein [Bacteroidales bacterium]